MVTESTVWEAIHHDQKKRVGSGGCYMMKLRKFSRGCAHMKRSLDCPPSHAGGIMQKWVWWENQIGADKD